MSDALALCVPRFATREHYNYIVEELYNIKVYIHIFQYVPVCKREHFNYIVEELYNIEMYNYVFQYISAHKGSISESCCQQYHVIADTIVCMAVVLGAQGIHPKITPWG